MWSQFVTGSASSSFDQVNCTIDGLYDRSLRDNLFRES